LSRRAYRDLPASLQSQVALAILSGQHSPSQLARQFGVDVEQIAQWRTQLQSSPKAEPAGNAPARPTNSVKAPVPRALPQIKPLGPLPRASAADDDFQEDATKIGDFPTLWEPPPARAAAPADSGVPEIRATRAEASRAPAAQPARAGSAPSVTARATAVPAVPEPGARAGFFASFFIGRRERREATKTSLEMLQIYQGVAAERPALRGPSLYRHVVVARMGVTLTEADSILRHAAESFAKWPVERPLIFRDVVHYIAISDYLAGNSSANWTRENVGKIVNKLVPESL